MIRMRLKQMNVMDIKYG